MINTKQFIVCIFTCTAECDRYPYSILQPCGNKWIFRMVIPGLGCKHCLGLHQRTAWFLNTLQTFEEDTGLTTWWRLYAHKERTFPPSRWGFRWFLNKGSPLAPKAERKESSILSLVHVLLSNWISAHWKSTKKEKTGKQPMFHTFHPLVSFSLSLI